MTKRVRIENADTANYKVIVQVWEKQYVPDGQPPGPDVLQQEITLANPCDMTGTDIYLTSTRYLVVKEA